MSKHSISEARSYRNFAITIYLISLVLPSYVTRESTFDMLGFRLLIIGWIAIGSHIYAWLANPLIIFCFFMMKKTPFLCLILSIAALVLSYDLVHVKSLGFDSSRDIAAGEVLSVGLGSVIWLASIILTIYACAVFLKEKRLEQKAKQAGE